MTVLSREDMMLSLRTWLSAEWTESGNPEIDHAGSDSLMSHLQEIARPGATDSPSVVVTDAGHLTAFLASVFLLSPPPPALHK